MSETIYRIQVDGETRMTFAGDFAQAGSPITLEGNSTPFQVADSRHRPNEAAEKLIAWADSEGGSNVGEDEEYEVVAVNKELEAMVAMLRRHGDRFTGNNVEDEAQGWLDHDFDADDASGWCEIGCWDAATAAELRDGGLSPQAAHDAAESLVEGLEDSAETYTDGDPIYSACNGDTDAQEIVNAAKERAA